MGLPDSLLGAGWPVIHEELNVPVSYMGVVTMVISGCTILSGTDVGFSHAENGREMGGDGKRDNLGRRPVGVFPCRQVLAAYSIGSSLRLSAGAIDAALNNYVALHYSSKHMSWLHCFWGVGRDSKPLCDEALLLPPRGGSRAFAL